MPFGPSDTIRKALGELLASKAPGQDGGFVIFNDEKGDYVQFALLPAGLNLFWADVNRIAPARVIPLLEQGTFEVASDGLYADFGRDIDRAEAFVLRAFREVFGNDPKTIEVELEIE